MEGVASLAEVFEAQVRARPASTAVTDGDTRLTYEELGNASDRVALGIQSHGVPPRSFVGVSTCGVTEALIAILGTLKAGCAYVPLDPHYPTERLAFMCSDAGVAIVVGDARAPRYPGLLTISLDGLPAATSAVRSSASPDDLAYVIYTSGSTGKPKGVCVTHRNVSELLRSADRLFDFGPEDAWTLFHSYSFDFSVWEIWGALSYGGRLVIVPEECRTSPQNFLSLLQSNSVTVLNQVPSVFRHLAREYAKAPCELPLRYIIFGGEALDRGAAKLWQETAPEDGAALINMYGITETTVHVTYKKLSKVDLHERRADTPIGLPLPHLDVTLLDDELAPVEAGEVGEMFVSGSGVAQGYLNRPDLTDERFVLIGDPPTRFYRSGDLAWRRPDGELEYVGRADSQVKVRGFRVELGEIEAVLEEVPEISDAAAVATENAAGETQLVAFYVRRDGAAPLADEWLRDTLRERLPDYMVPVRLTEVADLPFTPSGKRDRRALRERDRLRSTDAGRRRVRPEPNGSDGDEIHDRLEDIFRTVFGDPDLVLSPQHSADSIPEWDSLSHITLMVAIEEEFGIRFRGNELAECENVDELEDFLTRVTHRR